MHSLIDYFIKKYIEWWLGLECDVRGYFSAIRNLGCAGVEGMKWQREMERGMYMQGLLWQRHGCMNKGIIHEGLRATWVALVLCQLDSFMLETDIWRQGLMWTLSEAVWMDYGSVWREAEVRKQVGAGEQGCVSRRCPLVSRIGIVDVALSVLMRSEWRGRCLGSA